MSENTPEQQAPAAAPESGEQGNPDEAALGDAGKQALDRMKAERNEAKQAVASLQAQLAEINRANESVIEKATREANEAKEIAATATVEALRYKIAAESGIKDNADLILTAPDEETMRKQAALWVERAPNSPRPDPSQGAKGNTSKATTADMFAEAIEGSFTR